MNLNGWDGFLSAEKRTLLRIDEFQVALSRFTICMSKPHLWLDCGQDDSVLDLALQFKPNQVLPENALAIGVALSIPYEPRFLLFCGTEAKTYLQYINADELERRRQTKLWLIPANAKIRNETEHLKTELNPKEELLIVSGVLFESEGFSKANFSEHEFRDRRSFERLSCQIAELVYLRNPMLSSASPGHIVLMPSTMGLFGYLLKTMLEDLTPTDTMTKVDAELMAAIDRQLRAACHYFYPDGELIEDIWTNGNPNLDVSAKDRSMASTELIGALDVLRGKLWPWDPYVALTVTDTLLLVHEGAKVASEIEHLSKTYVRDFHVAELIAPNKGTKTPKRLHLRPMMSPKQWVLTHKDEQSWQEIAEKREGPEIHFREKKTLEPLATFDTQEKALQNKEVLCELGETNPQDILIQQAVCPTLKQWVQCIDPEWDPS